MTRIARTQTHSHTRILARLGSASQWEGGIEEEETERRGNGIPKRKTLPVVLERENRRDKLRASLTSCA